MKKAKLNNDDVRPEFRPFLAQAVSELRSQLASRFA